MQRKITGYHRDEHDDWVAELDCYHGQHVRHKPPFINRPWVETEAGRHSQLGQELNCVRCDNLELPADVTAYKRTPDFTEATIPAGLLRNHATKTGTWGKIHVLDGMLDYTVQEPSIRHFELQAGDIGIIAPTMLHNVAAQGSVHFYVEFYTRDKTNAGNPHTENLVDFSAGTTRT